MCLTHDELELCHAVTTSQEPLTHSVTLTFLQHVCEHVGVHSAADCGAASTAHLQDPSSFRHVRGVSLLPSNIVFPRDQLTHAVETDQTDRSVEPESYSFQPKPPHPQVDRECECVDARRRRYVVVRKSCPTVGQHREFSRTSESEKGGWQQERLCGKHHWKRERCRSRGSGK